MNGMNWDRDTKLQANQINRSGNEVRKLVNGTQQADAREGKYNGPGKSEMARAGVETRGPIKAIGDLPSRSRG